MPNYEYGCPDCGLFSMSRPMADYDRPQDCPHCGAVSHRVLVTMPAIAGMDAGTRLAMSTNERSSNAPRRSSAFGVHPSGCGCCRTASGTTTAPDGMKNFPSQRPWMISH
jgi:putative FmdB family regulatory protein